MKQFTKKTQLLIISLLVLLLFCSCQDEILDEVLRYSDYRAGLYAPIDQDEVNIVPGHGKDSYYPLVEGLTWYTRTEGAGIFSFYIDTVHGEVKINSVSQVDEYDYDWLVRFENISGKEGWREECYSSETGYSREGSSFNKIYLPLSSLHVMQVIFPRAEIDELYERYKGQTVSYESRSNDYDGITYIHYDNSLRDIYTPSGIYYKDCIHLTGELYFPNGYNQRFYQTKVDAYLAKGVGYVYMKIVHNTGEVAHVYVDQYTRFGETLTFDMNTTDTVSKTIAAKVYVEGEQITLPNVERDGYVLSGWQAIVDDQIIDTYAPGYTFTMADKDVTMKAVWSAE